MTFSVAISGVSPDPEVYGGLTAAGNYVGAMFAPAATSWLALSTNAKGQTLRAATLFLDRQPWEGDATGQVGVDATTLQWPRSGVTAGGEDVDSTTVPADVVNAAFEMAVLIAADPTIISKIDQGSNISSVGAGGGVAVSFFAQSSAANGTATRLPTVVQQLVAKYLATGGPVTEGGTGVYGNTCSSFTHANQLLLVLPE